MIKTMEYAKSVRLARMFRSRKIRLYPNKTQQAMLLQQLGNARKVYNYYLALRQRHYRMFGTREGFQPLSYYRCAKHLTKLKRRPRFAYLLLSHAWSLQAKLKDLDRAFIGLWKHKRGYPHFKSKHRGNNSMRYDKQHIRIKGNKVYLPKLGAMRFRGQLLKGDIVNATIHRTLFGRVVLSICYEIEQEVKEVNGWVGLDVNCHNLTVSDGKGYEQYDLGTYYFQDKICYWSKQLARCVKRSNRRMKARVILAKWYKKAADKRDYESQRLTTMICSLGDNQVRGFIIEDLNLNQMTRKGRHKRGLNRSLLDSNLGNILRMIAYKTGTMKADRFYPSSKRCSVCGEKYAKLRREDRTWICPWCRTKHDRDINAAENLLHWARNALHGDDGRPDGIYIPDGICLRSENRYLMSS